jgi:hypothetical protein
MVFVQNDKKPDTNLREKSRRLVSGSGYGAYQRKAGVQYRLELQTQGELSNTRSGETTDWIACTGDLPELRRIDDA